MTIGEFVGMIGSRLSCDCDNISSKGLDAAGELPCCICREEDIWERGQRNHWLDAYDVENREASLEKRTAAKILHGLLKWELNEADEAQWGEAAKLQDLYDCRTCVNHVAQVYAKGIMEAAVSDLFLFGMREVVTGEQARLYLDRCFGKAQRLDWIKIGSTDGKSITDNNGIANKESEEKSVLTREEAAQYISVCKPGNLVDVRSGAEYTKQHIDGAVSIPLTKILEKPEMIAEDKSELILLYCDAGYQSRIAANCLREAGFLNVIAFQTQETLNV